MIHIDISNFRAINHASLDVDGITVLAGENGSGKSTISKIVYHTFYTACHFDEIERNNYFEERVPLFWQFRDALSDFVSGLKVVFPEIKNIDFSARNMGNLSEYLPAAEAEFGKYFVDPLLYQDKRLINSRTRFVKSICSLVRANVNEGTNNPFELIRNKLQEIEKKYEEIKQNRPVKRFHNRMKLVFEQEIEENTICLKEIDENLINPELQRLNSTIDTREVYYCDTPWMVDRKQDPRLPIFFEEEEDIRLFHRNALRGVLRTCTKSTNDPHPIEIDEIIGGQTFAKEEEGGYKFEFKRGDGKILDLFHCATGLKAFSILQMLYLGGKLCKGTLLILDEPEANLHPQWVVEYARLIVLLWKQHGVRFLISSHSPDMVAAIQAIAQKEGVRESTKFYLAERSKSNSFKFDYKDLGFEISEIFASFNKSMVGIVKYGADID